MRTEFVEGGTRQNAQTACPWAAVIFQADGGWMCFESVSDADTWAGQE